MNPVRDVTAIIAQKIAQNLARYPKHALSHRDVLMTLPGGELEFGRVDAALTNAIWDAAVQGRTVSSDELVTAARKACNLKIKVQRDRSLKSFVSKTGVKTSK